MARFKKFPVNGHEGKLVYSDSIVDNIVKLVRESYVRVIETPATDNNLNRLEYSYFQQFDAGLVTASYFGLQSTQA